MNISCIDIMFQLLLVPRPLSKAQIKPYKWGDIRIFSGQTI